MTSICLTMIVKDEEPVILRCLESVLPIIDCWCIVDTGSEDNTRNLIKEYLCNIPGYLHNRPWVDFGHNRTECLRLAEGTADLFFTIDADEVLSIGKDFNKNSLSCDLYALNIDHSGLSYLRTCLGSLKKHWKYKGVIHEYITCEEKFTTCYLNDLSITVHSDGARSRNLSDKDKYRRDAELLHEALRKDPTNDRYAFYLAQSYRDAGDLYTSLKAYEHRVKMGGWNEEVWYSLFQIACLSEKIGFNDNTIISRYLMAYNFRPTRAEPLVMLARFFRNNRQYSLANHFARLAAQIPRPNDSLFIDEHVYRWRALDELAVSSYWTGQFQACVDTCKELINSDRLPDSEILRVKENLHLAWLKLI